MGLQVGGGLLEDNWGSGDGARGIFVRGGIEEVCVEGEAALGGRGATWASVWSHGADVEDKVRQKGYRRRVGERLLARRVCVVDGEVLGSASGESSEWKLQIHLEILGQ